MGANIDAVAEAENLGIKRKHAVTYKNDPEGVALNYNIVGDVMCMVRGAAPDCEDEDIDEGISRAFEPIRRHLRK